MTDNYDLMIYIFFGIIFVPQILLGAWIMYYFNLPGNTMWQIFRVANAFFSFANSMLFLVLYKSYVIEGTSYQTVKKTQVIASIISIPIFVMSIVANAYLGDVRDISGIASIISTVITGIHYIIVIIFVKYGTEATNNPDT